MPALLNPDEPMPVRLMSTVWADRSGLHDDLETVDGLREWLAATGDSDPEVEVSPSERDLELYRRLRDALRRLAALRTGDTREAAVSPTREVCLAVEDVNAAVAQAPTWPLLAFEDDELVRRSAGEAPMAERRLSSIAVRGIELLTGPDAADLRSCYAPGCVLYFVKDHPRREWCSAGCGNRARAARHYARHRKGLSVVRGRGAPSVLVNGRGFFIGEITAYITVVSVASVRNSR
ncbi:ABATE domain-containing protein [Salininema proteolyticum]|uniref:ABATE domain-containing protein n=1 Tax=Salininema proteolyticum TaxID=1607685 RepID=A0ABV8TUP6_9ACTN